MANDVFRVQPWINLVQQVGFTRVSIPLDVNRNTNAEWNGGNSNRFEQRVLCSGQVDYPRRDDYGGIFDSVHYQYRCFEFESSSGHCSRTYLCPFSIPRPKVSASDAISFKQFHQVVRAMTPLFTIVLSALFFRKRYSRNTYLSLLPVVAGVVFATYGDYYFTAWGLILTLIGTALAAVKTVSISFPYSPIQLNL